jgi:ATP-dependent RNA helicase SUPV3L1/SUV3
VLASGGRTSIPIDKEIAKPLYRTVGYRVCGERAVRVDILERLADLIRPALTWREGASGAKPPGAFDGTGFTVTGAMTSLTGASGEDFASILRSLGYRMERRPKPAEPAKVETSPEAEKPPDVTKVENSAESAPVATADESSASPTLTPDAEPVAAGSVASEVIAAAPEQPAALLPENSFAVPERREETSEPSEKVEQLAEARPGEVEIPPSSVAAPDSPAVAAGPEMIEVWRTGRPSGQRHRRDAGQRRRRPDQAAPPQAVAVDGQAVAAADVPAAADAAPAADSAGGERKERHGRPRHRRDQPREERKDGDQARAPRRADRQSRPDQKRPDRERPDRPPRGDRPNRPPRRDRDRDDNRPGRIWSSGNERQGKEADPNSPFAKLLALKEQLEANKER